MAAIQIERAASIHVRCVVLIVARRPKPPVTTAIAVVNICHLIACVGSSLTFSVFITTETPFSLSYAKTEYVIFGVISGVGSIFEGDRLRIDFYDAP
jgi:hypothetical protein